MSSERFLKIMRHSLSLWGVLRILELFRGILMGFEWLLTVRKRSEVFFDVLETSEAFMNVLWVVMRRSDSLF